MIFIHSFMSFTPFKCQNELISGFVAFSSKLMLRTNNLLDYYHGNSVQYSVQ